MKQPKTIKGYIACLKMLESIDIGSLKRGRVNDGTVKNLVHIQAQISNEIDTI
jgi:hypothetical protein